MRKSVLATVVLAFLAGSIITGLVMASNGGPTVEERYNKVERGCLACHYKNTQYSLYNISIYYGSFNHTDYVASGEEGDLSKCTSCHDENPVQGEAKPFSDIVHPAHMYSKVFLGEGNFTGIHSGNCFSCHDMNGQTGQYKVLYEPVDTDLKGVPNSSYYEDMDGMKDWSNGKGSKW